MTGYHVNAPYGSCIVHVSPLGRDRPAAGAEVAAGGRRRRGLRGAGVADLEHVALVLRHRRADDEVLAGVLERHVGAVEGHRRRRRAARRGRAAGGRRRRSSAARWSRRPRGCGCPASRPGRGRSAASRRSGRRRRGRPSPRPARSAPGRGPGRRGPGGASVSAGQGRGAGRRLRWPTGAPGDWPPAGSRPSSRRVQPVDQRGGEEERPRAPPPAHEALTRTPPASAAPAGGRGGSAP